jgi:hypothetical protein
MPLHLRDTLTLTVFLVLSIDPAARAIELQRVVIDSAMPGGYQVEVADVNGDGRLDVIGLGGGTCAWYENPSWTKHVVSTSKETPGIISSATADLDGDGKAEIAIAYEFGMNEPKKGKLLLASQDGSGGWTHRPIADIGSIHRLRWGDVDGDKRPDLVVAPIFGPEAHAPDYNQAPAKIITFRNATKEGPWTGETVGERPVLHGIKVLDYDGDGRSDVLSADNLGVSLFVREDRGWSGKVLTPGAPGEAPKRGSSEIQVGRLAEGRRFLATIDPWHGTEVAVCMARNKDSDSFEPRTVLDASLKEGHALWVADVDGDGDDEVFAGYRGTGTSVLFFDYDRITSSWTRTVLDPAIAAQDLRGGDLDGDGSPDVVAIGGRTHNVVWYKFRAKAR